MVAMEKREPMPSDAQSQFPPSHGSIRFGKGLMRFPPEVEVLQRKAGKQRLWIPASSELNRPTKRLPDRL
jgi:hypothetical protein